MATIRYEQRTLLDAATAIARRDAILSTAKVVEHMAVDANLPVDTYTVRSATEDTAIITFTTSAAAKYFKLWLRECTKQWIIDSTTHLNRYYVSRVATSYHSSGY
jgi:hypothetical protein